MGIFFNYPNWIFDNFLVCNETNEEFGMKLERIVNGLPTLTAYLYRQKFLPRRKIWSLASEIPQGNIIDALDCSYSVIYVWVLAPLLFGKWTQTFLC